MSRPREYDARRSTAIRFDQGLHERLVVAAREREVSVNFLVNRAVAEFLNHLLPLDEVKWTRPPGAAPMPPPAPPTPATHMWDPLTDSFVPLEPGRLADP